MEDYPMFPMRREMQGTVEFRLTVGPDGRTMACEVVKSSGFAELDEMTCNLMMRRARFCPATNRKARPIVGSWSSRLKWVYPGE